MHTGDAHHTGQPHSAADSNVLKDLGALRVLAREILDHPGGHAYHAEIIEPGGTEPPYLDVINRAHPDLREYIYHLDGRYCWSWRDPIGHGDGAIEAAEQIREVLSVRADDG